MLDIACNQKGILIPTDSDDGIAREHFGFGQLAEMSGVRR